MRFDAVIGNPPYQETTGGGGVIKHATPLYNLFYKQAIEKIATDGSVCMIIPTRWMAGGSTDLKDFRCYISECKHIKCIYSFEKSNEVFKDVSIAGGVCFLVFDKKQVYEKTEIITARNKDNKLEIIDRNYIDLSKYIVDDSDYILIRKTLEQSILDKVLSTVQERDINMLSNRIFKGIPYKLDTTFEGRDSLTDINDLKVICGNGRETYININDLQKDIETVDNYKVIINRLNPDRAGVNARETWSVITEPKILRPKEIFNNTFTGIADCKSLDEAERIKAYLKTKFVRFLIQVTIYGIHITGNNFSFVPDLYNSIEISDKNLYKIFRLNENEIELIEKRIVYKG